MMQNIAIATASARKRESYGELLERLSELSVTRYHDPFTDIDWDAAEHRIDPDDPRFELDPSHPLALSAWHAALDGPTRARFGLAFGAQTLKNGIRLEAALSRGLLDVCSSWPDGSLEYRYAMHEVIEECRHSLMFQEFINRSGVATRGQSQLDRFLDNTVLRRARQMPELFFLAVLAGELFIDEQNRRELQRPRSSVHPLLRRVMQIHVTEEARHVCFAERFLRQHLPALDPVTRERIAWTIPVICGVSSRIMLIPDAQLVARFGIPRRALRDAFGPGTAYRQRLVAAAEPIRTLCEQHGMLRRRHARMWSWCGFEA
jgi:hypothetical protein